MKKIIYIVFTLPMLIILAGCPVTATGADNSITGFSFNEFSPVAAATITGSAVEISVPYGTDLTALVAEFSSTGAAVTVEGIAQVSGTTPNDFTDPVTYTITAEDGSTYQYVVIVTIALSTDKEIESFTFTTENNFALTADIVGEINGNEIKFKVPYDIAVTSFVVTFVTSGTSVSVNDIFQFSGITENNFSDTVV
jgi:hypothetical protein